MNIYELNCMDALVIGFEKQAAEMGLDNDFMLGFEKELALASKQAHAYFEANKTNPEFLQKISTELSLVIGVEDAKALLKAALETPPLTDEQQSAGGLARRGLGRNFGTGLGDISMGGMGAGGVGGGLLGLLLGSLSGHPLGMLLGTILGGAGGAALWPKIFPGIFNFMKTNFGHKPEVAEALAKEPPPAAGAAGAGTPTPPVQPTEVKPGVPETPAATPAATPATPAPGVEEVDFARGMAKTPTIGPTIENAKKLPTSATGESPLDAVMKQEADNAGPEPGTVPPGKRETLQFGAEPDLPGVTSQPEVQPPAVTPSPTTGLKIPTPPPTGAEKMLTPVAPPVGTAVPPGITGAKGLLPPPAPPAAPSTSPTANTATSVSAQAPQVESPLAGLKDPAAGGLDLKTPPGTLTPAALPGLAAPAVDTSSLGNLQVPAAPGLLDPSKIKLPPFVPPAKLQLGK